MAIIKLDRLHSFIKRLAFNNAIKQLKVIKLNLEPQLKLDPGLRLRKAKLLLVSVTNLQVEVCTPFLVTFHVGTSPWSCVGV